ncbi:MAG TPA: PDDEXK nuclease domain-containing protein [Puia sp.]|nr:PDDEXK nuclease domain-containing protein [Puia sp.]
MKDKIQTRQIKAAITVNRELLNLYWELGKEICEKQEKANWGDALIDQLAKDLSAAFPGVKGFSMRNLFYIKKWYLFYSTLKLVQQVVAVIKETSQPEESEKVSELVRQIPWGHNIEIIMKCPDVESALFYVRETIKNNWSRSALALQIESKLYERQGKAIQNFQSVLPIPQADLARETLKNPYNFDFLTLGKEAGERGLETALTDHIQKFILELGQGFAYLGKQFAINVAGDDFYLDLLFYHTRLRCYVIVELKATEFKPEYAGKLNFYLNVVNAQLKHPQDQPSIGILLCKTPNKVMVEYALQNINNPLGVAEYQIINAVPDNLKGDLPSVEELEQELGEPLGAEAGVVR